VIRPSASGPLLLLALGAFLDFFWNARMGLWGLSLISAYGLSLAGRSLMAGQGLVVMGGWYAAVCCLGLGLAYLFATIGAHEQPNIFAAVWQLAWTLGLYPAVAYMVDRFEDADVRFR
jgi:rod shape-determining protein MreD